MSFKTSCRAVSAAENLAGKTRNLAVVGDDDPGDLRLARRGRATFARFFSTLTGPDAEIVKLEENYRSSQVILDAAHAVVACNEDRQRKRLYTRRDGGDPIVFFGPAMIAPEARFVVESILRMQAEEGYFPEDFAVILPHQRAVAALRGNPKSGRLPFSLLGACAFSRAEIKDVLAYLRLC